MRRVDESAWKFEAKPEKEFELTVHQFKLKIDPIQSLRECTTVAQSAWKFQSKR